MLVQPLPLLNVEVSQGEMERGDSTFLFPTRGRLGGTNRADPSVRSVGNPATSSTIALEG